MAGSYRIVDEPTPGPLSRLVVQPLWPLLALMLAGSWLGYPWFVVNAFAVGSPSRAKETFWAALGFVGSLALGVGLLALAGTGVLPEPALPYAAVGIVAWRLGVGYVLYTLQSRSFHLYTYFGGPVRNGLWVLLVAVVFMRARLLGLLPSPLWQIALG